MSDSKVVVVTGVSSGSDARTLGHATVRRTSDIPPKPPIGATRNARADHRTAACTAHASPEHRTS